MGCEWRAPPSTGEARRGGATRGCVCVGARASGVIDALPPWRKVTAAWLEKPVDLGLKTRADLVSHARARERAAPGRPRPSGARAYDAAPSAPTSPLRCAQRAAW